MHVNLNYTLGTGTTLLGTILDLDLFPSVLLHSENLDNPNTKKMWCS
jgi:hypothetical protein